MNIIAINVKTFYLLILIALHLLSLPSGFLAKFLGIMYSRYVWPLEYKAFDTTKITSFQLAYRLFSLFFQSVICTLFWVIFLKFFLVPSDLKCL